MLVLVVLWIVLALLCACAGLAFMGPAASLFVRTGDRLLFASFLGLAVIGAILLAWSLVAPVTPVALASCAVLALAGVAGQRAARASVLEAADDRGLAAQLGGILVLALLLAERSTVAGNLNDAGAYHVGIIRWLSEYGTVRGMALIQDRFGFVSSWLAWSAALDHGELAGRIGTAMSGLLLLLCLGQLLLVTLRVWRQRVEPPDLFVLLAWLVLLPSFLNWDQRPSPSPDIPALVFGIVAAWAILVIESQATQPAVSRARLMVLLVALGALLVKLSAAPLVAACGLYFVWAQSRVWPARLGAASLAGVVFFGVLAAAGLVSSGCAFFPWSGLCTDVPWSIGRDSAEHAAKIVHDWALGSFDRPQLHGTALLAAWIDQNRDLARWIVLSAIAGAWLLFRRRRLDIPGVGWASTIGVIGVPFFLITAPAGRFGWSYLVVLPLLALLSVRAWLAKTLLRWIANPVARRRLGIVLTALLAIDVTAPFYKEFINSESRAKTYESVARRKQGDPAANALNLRWWLLPNQYADLPGFAMGRAYDFDYAVPPRDTGMCWHHALPCTYQDLARVRLIDPGLGLSGGFERVRSTAR